MDKSIELPIQDCDLKVTVGSDGVWLHFGGFTTIHVHNKLGGGHGIIEKNIDKWRVARQEQAKAL